MIGQWIAIAVLVFLGLTLLKVDHHTKKIKILTLLVIAAVIYFSIVGHFASEEIDLKSPRGIVNSVYLYFGWIGSTASQLWDIGVDTSHLVGNAIKVNSTEDKQKK
ncbi:hypothetical protein HNV12_02470 [Methanococcoides sp. SA1]|nr:hypothetical protein [Methanococcoides sp. SA1]